MSINIQFIYGEKLAIIQTVKNEYFKNIFQKYSLKTSIDLKKFHFLHKGNELNENLRVEDLNSNENPLQIIVQEIKDAEKRADTDTGEDNSISKFNPDLKQSNEIICPICREDCVIKVDEFKISLEECPKGHKLSDISLPEFNKTQIINEANIICDVCKTKKSDLTPKTIYKCFQCNLSICYLCKVSHDKSHTMIDLDLEKYMCKVHGEKNIFYCEDCHENICDKCDCDHYEKGHNLLYLKEVFEDKKIGVNFKDFLQKLEKCKKEIEKMLYKIKTVYNNLDIYYKMANNLMSAYSQRHKNYISVRNLNNLNKFNKSIIGDIENIINGSNIENKITAVFRIYDRLEINDSDENKEHNYIRYKIGKKKKIRIFGDEFVKNNKDSCKIIFDNKEYELTSFFDIKNFTIQDEILEIKLKEMNNIKNLSHMFNECSSLIELPSDLSNLKTENETSLSYMFNNCSQLTSIPNISKWDTKNIKDMSYMFTNCSSLKSLPNISKWNTENVKDISFMFSNCSLLSEFPDISNWNIQNATNKENMFNECPLITNIPSFKKSEITDSKNAKEEKKENLKLN